MAVCLPQEAETVGLVRAAITNTLRVFGVDDECIDDIRLAVSEACTNVVQHAAGEDEYEVVVHVENGTCSVSVKNTGQGFDASSLTGVLPGPESARGRGVAIMQAVMDGVEFRSTPEQGTIVHLVRDLTFRKGGLFPASRSESGGLTG